jgi:RNA polymerase sigma-70 factor (ECF subfamily)
MSEMDELVQRCQAGELAAFTTLFRHYEARVYRLALAIVRDERDAEDAVQDAFLRVFERIKHFRGDASLDTWFTAIVVNVCRDRLRRRQVRQALPLEWLHGRPEHGDDPVETVSRRVERRALWALVDRLDDRHRLPVLLHYYEGLPCDDVARILGLRLTTVYARLNTARIRLRDMARTPALQEEIGEGRGNRCSSARVEE